MLPYNSVTLLGLLRGGGGGLAVLGGSRFLLSLAAELGAVVGLIPLAERRSIDLDNSSLGEGVGADELVVRRVVRNANYTGLARDTL